MMDPTPLALTLLVALVLERCVLSLADWLNLRGMAPEPPAAFREEVDAERWSKAREYLGAKTRLGLVQRAVEFGALLVFWWVGGFGTLDSFVRAFGWGELPTGLAYLGILALASGLLGLPFAWHHDFGIERRFGFHRQSVGSWWGDRLKGVLVGILIGTPLISVLLWAFDSLGSSGWLVAWALAGAWTLLVQYLAPSFILPLFMKFAPLEDEGLREDLDALAGATGFPLTEVSVVDASNRSSHANAFFTGLGKRKRIALFDTLLERHSRDEVTAVLAHEIGHWKLGHIWRGTLFSMLQLGGFLWLLGWVLRTPEVFEAFGVAAPSVHVGLVLFGVLTSPLSLVLGPLFAALSRRNEFQADAFAVQTTQRAPDLVRALTRLSKESLSNLTPHPLYVTLHYSHPPLVHRVRALEQAG